MINLIEMAFVVQPPWYVHSHSRLLLIMERLWNELNISWSNPSIRRSMPCSDRIYINNARAIGPGGLASLARTPWMWSGLWVCAYFPVGNLPVGILIIQVQMWGRQWLHRTENTCSDTPTRTTSRGRWEWIFTLLGHQCESVGGHVGVEVQASSE